MNSPIYSSKTASDPAKETHGCSGWRRVEGGVWEGLIFNQSPGEPAGIGQWLPAETYRSQQAEKRRISGQFYKDHPNLLREKIREKKGVGKLYFGRGCPVPTGGWEGAGE